MSAEAEFCSRRSCQKEIRPGELIIRTNYGPHCSAKCWMETAKDIVGYGYQIVGEEDNGDDCEEQFDSLFIKREAKLQGPSGSKEAIGGCF